MEINNLSALERKETLIERTEESRYYLSSEEYNIILKTLQQLIDDYNDRIDEVDGVTLKSVIKSDDDVTPPSDSNVFTALRTLKEMQAVIAQANSDYLSKKHDDSAAGKIDFQKGLEVNFQPGMQGANISETGNSELDSLKVRKWLEVPELRYNRVEVLLGDKWRAPGGGVIQHVDAENKIITLKLEDGEIGAVSVNDLCFGIIHSLDSSENSTVNSDNGKGTRLIQGFATSYFKVEEIISSDGTNQTFRYSLRPLSANYTKQVHPKEFMHFVGFGNTSNVDRQNSAYETRTYERFLTGINNWEYTQLNIAAQFGDLSNLSAFGLNMQDYSIYLSNVYFTGNIQQVKAPIIIDGYWHRYDQDTGEWINTGVKATEPGKGALELYLTNNSILLHESEVIDYGPTVTHVHVYEGENELTFEKLEEWEEVENPGRYTISVEGNNIVPGEISLDNIHGVISEASDIVGNSAYILVTVRGKRNSGEAFTRKEYQNIALVHDGEDGDTVEFIFKQTDSLSRPDPDPADLDAVQEPDFVPSVLNNNPTYIGWTDDPKGIDVENKYEWRAQRIKKNGVWQKFNSPVLSSRWGENGLDGKDYEYIFKRTAELIPPSPSPSQLEPNQEPDFTPNGTYSGLEFVGWTDDFVGPSKNLRYSWLCKRERINGLWGRFTDPEVWSTYSVDGNSVETVYQNTSEMLPPFIDEVEAIQIDNYIPEDWTKYPESISLTLRFQWESKREKINEVWTSFSAPSLHSVYGEDGTDIEFIFNLTEDETPPSIVYISPDFNNRTPQDAEYLPGDGTSSGWQDDHIWVTKEKPYLWVTKRRKIDGVWEDFKSPKILSVRGKDGGDYEAVYKLTGLITPPPQLISSHGDFQKPEYLPKDENGNNWLDERASISEELPYLWISERRKKDGVWQPFSPPSIDANWAKPGDPGNDGAMLEFWGAFDPTVTYVGNSEKIIAVKHGSLYYKTKTDAGEFEGSDYPYPMNPPPSGPDYYPWELFGNTFKSVATDLLLAAEANVANFYFKNQRLESRPAGKDNAELAMYLDGKTGEAMFGNNSVLFSRDGSGHLARGNITWDHLGAGTLAGGNISWNAAGDLTLKGTFESNNAGNRIVIDPIARSLKMINNRNYALLTMDFTDMQPTIHLRSDIANDNATIGINNRMFLLRHESNNTATLMTAASTEISNNSNGNRFYVGVGPSTLVVQMKGLIQLSSASAAAAILSSGELWRNSNNQVFYNP